MAIKETTFAYADTHGVTIEPINVKAHYGVIEYSGGVSGGDEAAVIHVNAGQVIFRTSGTYHYCLGYADNGNVFMNPEVTTPVLKLRLKPGTALDAARVYAQWIDGENVGAKKFDPEEWELSPNA